MTDNAPLQVGDNMESAQFSPCVGGLVRTWVEGRESKLWSTPDAEWLFHMQATGQIGRTLQEERRFREAAWLSEDGAALIVQPRFPVKVDSNSYSVEAHIVRLEPAGRPSGSVYDEFRTLLARAVQQCVANDEFLVVEKGGWDAPQEPFCLFIVIRQKGGLFSVIETAPDPHGAELWEPHIVPGRKSQSLRAPADPKTIDVVPILMIDAIRQWRLQPWDLALTFGQR